MDIIVQIINGPQGTTTSNCSDNTLWWARPQPVGAGRDEGAQKSVENASHPQEPKLEVFAALHPRVEVLVAVWGLRVSREQPQQSRMLRDLAAVWRDPAKPRGKHGLSKDGVAGEFGVQGVVPAVRVVILATAVILGSCKCLRVSDMVTDT